jgi:hypothetical protein
MFRWSRACLCICIFKRYSFASVTCSALSHQQNSKWWLFVSSSTIFPLVELLVSSSRCNLFLENGMQMHTLSQLSVFRSRDVRGSHILHSTVLALLQWRPSLFQIMPIFPPFSLFGKQVRHLLSPPIRSFFSPYSLVQLAILEHS